MIDSADPDALRLDDLDSNASLDEDAVPMRKVTANNKVSLKSSSTRSECAYANYVAGYANLDRGAQSHTSPMARDAGIAK